MKKNFIRLATIIAVLSFLYTTNALAEDLPSGVIEKLQKTANDPVLSNGKVYPFWGPVCQRYTYSVVYSDKQNRPPEYVKIYFNGKMLDMEKEDSSNSDYKKGVKYIYKNVPNKFGSNFYYFEASNGLGKARDSIIDSPDNGPVLFDSDFKNNEIVLIDPSNGQVKWRYPTGEEWIGGIALSNDGKFLAAQTSNHVYYFDTQKDEPLWQYESATKSSIGGDVKGGVAISAAGDRVFAAINGQALMFDDKSNTPLWTYNTSNNGGSAYGVDISSDGSMVAVAMAGSESDENSNVLLLFDKDGNKKWQYHSSGNWHEVSLSQDGSYVTGSTGCPDRRGYLFSKDSAVPLIKSDPLSEESPIDEASISADGGLVVFGVESAYGAIVLMDRQTKQVVWKYETEQGRSVRALAMTPNGNYIGAGTFGGDVLIFSKDTNQPTKKLSINSAIGAFDIDDSGSLFATGSADKKVRIFSRDLEVAKAEITLNEYIGEIDLSSNGRYLAVGTSGSVYFFESVIDLNSQTVFPCDKVIEPAAEDTSLFGGQNGGDVVNNKQEQGDKTKSIPLPSIICLSFAGSIIIFVFGYLVFCRKRAITAKKYIVLIGVSLAVILLSVAYYFYTNQTSLYSSETGSTGAAVEASQTVSTDSNDETTNQDGTIENDAANTKTVSGSGNCGNGICEPDNGETKGNCSQDCM